MRSDDEQLNEIERLRDALAAERSAHAETRAKRDEIEVELRIQRDEALAHQCTHSERKVLEAMAMVEIASSTRGAETIHYIAMGQANKLAAQAEIDRRGEKQ